ncbi:glycoside hydrolase family 16 protein [Curtobacterium sp. MCBA15_004]|uniref:glycoside hydrolase family 16 protein n=1 Tax=unclassified Curtobacterium TaxID=257496 RepID=UPI0008DCD1DE|nr:glycoside hydrolase family 16 protein [Curtobacterium sp. MCBA15_004]WIA95581.1 glycoside hydrolase family 16 protein [Curtobacterium sp. MCBA15_004]
MSDRTDTGAATGDVELPPPPTPGPAGARVDGDRAPAAHGAGSTRHGRGRRRGARRLALAAGALVVAAGSVVAATTGGGTAADPSGEAMPAADGGDWRRVFSEDFATPTATGAFESRYGERFSVYHGFADTAGTGRYSASALTARDGVLDVRLRTTAAGTPLAGGIVPLVDGRWGGQTAGRYSIRMRSDHVDGYGVAVLLWSDENVWADGEIDFPEGDLGTPAFLNVHCLADPAEKCIHHQTEASLADWHTYTIEWTPERMSFLVDGRVVGSTTEDIPTARMHLVVQAGSNGGVPPREAAGSLLVDWMTIDVPAPGRTPRATMPGAGAVGD